MGVMTCQFVKVIVPIHTAVFPNPSGTFLPTSSQPIPSNSDNSSNSREGRKESDFLCSA